MIPMKDPKMNKELLWYAVEVFYASRLVYVGIVDELSYRMILL